MRTIYYKFVDFWSQEFDPCCLRVFQVFSSLYQMVPSDNPDILFFSCFGDAHYQFNCLKVFISHEPQEADFRLCDFAFSFEPTTTRNFQLLNFLAVETCKDVTKKNYIDRKEKFLKCDKNKFCNFLYSNAKALERIEFCKLISEYKRVDCPGPVLNNMPDFPKTNYLEKIAFLSEYKFTIAFENESRPYYTTEKIFHAFLAGSIPIYWGNPRVAEYFNTRAFVNVHDYENFDAAIRRVIQIDNDPALYQKVMNEIPVHRESQLRKITDAALQARVTEIVEHIESPQRVSIQRGFGEYKRKRMILKFISYLVNGTRHMFRRLYRK